MIHAHFHRSKHASLQMEDVLCLLLVQSCAQSSSSCIPMKIYTAGLKQNEKSGLDFMQCK